MVSLLFMTIVIIVISNLIVAILVIFSTMENDIERNNTSEVEIQIDLMTMMTMVMMVMVMKIDDGGDNDDW